MYDEYTVSLDLELQTAFAEIEQQSVKATAKERRDLIREIQEMTAQVDRVLTDDRPR
jgi:hypothetical protein